MPKIPGVLKGLGITAKTMAETLFPDGLKKPIPQPSKGAATVQYPHVREEPAAARPWRHLAQGRELHLVHALRARVP